MKNLYFFGPDKSIEYRTLGNGIWMQSVNKTLKTLEIARSYCERFGFTLVRRDV